MARFTFEYFSHGMILSCQSPIFRRTLRDCGQISCQWGAETIHSMLKFLYGIPVETDAENSTLELLLCATYYQVKLTPRLAAWP